MKSLSARWTVICGQDMDENNPYSRRGKDFSSYIACEFQDDVVGSSFVTGVVLIAAVTEAGRNAFHLCGNAARELLC